MDKIIKWGVQVDVDERKDIREGEVLRNGIAEGLRNIVWKSLQLGEDGRYLYPVPEVITFHIERGSGDTPTRVTILCLPAGSEGRTDATG